MKKPGRHHLNQVIKFNITSDQSLLFYVSLTLRDEKTTSALWCSFPKLSLIIRKCQTNPKWGIFYKISLFDSWDRDRDKNIPFVTSIFEKCQVHGKTGKKTEELSQTAKASGDMRVERTVESQSGSYKKEISGKMGNPNKDHNVVKSIVSVYVTCHWMGSDSSWIYQWRISIMSYPQQPCSYHVDSWIWLLLWGQ